MDSSSINKFQIFYMVTVSAIAITCALIYTRPVLMPLTFAIFYYFASFPLVLFLEKRLKTPRFISFIVTSTIVGGISIGICFQIILSFKNFFSGIEIYQQSFLSLIDSINDVLKRFGFGIDTSSYLDLFSSLPVKDYFTQAAGGALGLIGNLLLIIVIYLFLMVGRTTPSANRSSFFQEIEKKIANYVVNKILLSALTGILIGGVLLSFGVELSLIFGVLAFVLNFIPSIGSVVATLLPIPIIALQYGLGWKFLTILAICTAIQLVIGNFIDPKIIGRDLDLHPIVIILSLVFWGLIWGVGGMFLAVPLTAILKIILSKLDATHSLSEALAGRL